MRSAAVAALLVAIAAGAAHADCPGGMAERPVVELLFGRNIGSQLGVTQAQFRAFLDQEVTPRFPDGFSVLDMNGQYRQSADRPLVREPGKLVMIVLDDEARDLPSVQAIITAYKSRFRQKSVGLIARRACAAF